MLSERAGLEHTLGRYDALQRQVGDMTELLQLAESEGDAGVIDEVGGGTGELEQRLRELEMSRMLSGPQDRADAIL